MFGCQNGRGNDEKMKKNPADARRLAQATELINAPATGMAKRIQDAVAKATVTLPAKGGRGVLISGGFILTAAHCIDFRCDGSMALGGDPPVKVQTYRGNFNVATYAIEPCSDVAVLGRLDDQEYSEDCDAFETFVENTKPVTTSRQDFKRESNRRQKSAVENPAPSRIPPPDFERPHKFPVYIYGSKNEWITGTAIQQPASPRWTGIETAKKIESGFSGGPIINQAGELVGIVSWSCEQPQPDGRFYSSFPRPHLALPVWVYRTVFGESE
jgi:hypothetical protein